MPFAEQFVKQHNASGKYVFETVKCGYRSYNNRDRWVDHIICDDLVFSHRRNGYTKKTFTEGLHTHDYYEMIVYISGDVEYVKDDTLIKPMPFSVVWFAPGQMHTARLLSDSEYERYVFYFSDGFFRFNGLTVPMTDFISNTSVLHPDILERERIKNILSSIKTAAESNAEFGGLLSKAYIIELFAVLNEDNIGISSGVTLSDEMMQVKKYIDTHFRDISSVAEVAKGFHYSREHLSRRFRESFNISISDYISKRRILESLPLLGSMKGAEAAYAVGFKSQSAFIAAFVKNMGQLPSKYRKQKI